MAAGQIPSLARQGRGSVRCLVCSKVLSRDDGTGIRTLHADGGASNFLDPVARRGEARAIKYAAVVPFARRTRRSVEEYHPLSFIVANQHSHRLAVHHADAEQLGIMPCGPSEVFLVNLEESWPSAWIPGLNRIDPNDETNALNDNRHASGLERADGASDGVPLGHNLARETEIDKVRGQHGIIDQATLGNRCAFQQQVIPFSSPAFKFWGGIVTQDIPELSARAAPQDT